MGSRRRVGVSDDGTFYSVLEAFRLGGSHRPRVAGAYRSWRFPMADHPRQFAAAKGVLKRPNANAQDCRPLAIRDQLASYEAHQTTPEQPRPKISHSHTRLVRSMLRVSPQRPRTGWNVSPRTGALS